MNEPKPTHTWTCDCGEEMRRYRGEGDQDCPQCGQWFNAGGQRLRSHWADNPSARDDDIGDLEGFELTRIISDHPYQKDSYESDL